jgi:hypothetical protein
MPLTRNLYEIDEVVSALGLTVRRNNMGKALFWLWELLVSDEPQLAFSTLENAWLLWGGGNDPLWLESGPPQTTAQWLVAVQRVGVACQWTGSLNGQRFINITAEMITAPPADPVYLRPEHRTGAMRFSSLLSAGEGVSGEEAAAFWVKLYNACVSGKRIDSTWLIQNASERLSADAVWSAIYVVAEQYPDAVVLLPIVRLLRSSAGAHPVSLLKYQVAVLLIMCETAGRRKEMCTPAKFSTGLYERYWGEWLAECGRRSVRQMAIPVDALHAGTRRGGMTPDQSTLSELWNPVAGLVEGCKFWRTVLSGGEGVRVDADTGEVVFDTDEALEEFYVRYFPDDIPDEWSLADQLKSHGPGAKGVGPADPTTLYIRETPLPDTVWTSGISIAGLRI